MKMVMIVLFNEHHLSDVLLALTSAFGSRVTIMDALSGTENLLGALPIFADFGGRHSRFCKILLCLTDSENPLNALHEQMRLGGLSIDPDDLEIYVLPVEQAFISE